MGRRVELSRAQGSSEQGRAEGQEGCRGGRKRGRKEQRLQGLESALSSWRNGEKALGDLQESRASEGRRIQDARGFIQGEPLQSGGDLLMLLERNLQIDLAQLTQPRQR